MPLCPSSSALRETPRLHNANPIRSTVIRRCPSAGLRIAVFLAAAAVFAPTANAGNFYWVGDNVNNGTAWNAVAGLGGSNWSFSPNFNQSTGTSVPGSSDNVFFYFSGANTNNLNTTLGQDFSILSLDFLSGATTSVTIGGGNTLTLGTGGLVIEQGSGTHTISSKVALGGVETWSNNSTNAFTVSGVISGGASNNLTIGGISGSGGFNFTNANTYTGTTTLATAGATLTLSGANGSLATSAISMFGGSVLNLDNTVANNSNRVSSTVPITSAGGTINLKGASASQTIGSLTLNPGATVVNVDPGSTLTLGSAATPGLVRNRGGAVNFSTNGSVIIPNQTITTGLIGTHATIGNIGSVQQDAAGNSNILDWATLNGSNQVVPFTNYALNDLSAATNNTKVDSNGGTGGLITLAPNTTTTINTLYMTGASRIQLGTVGTTGSGIANVTNLVIGAGGIISNGATLTLGGSGPQIDMTNSAELGSGVVSANNANGGNITGNITVSPNAVTNAADLVVTTASNLRISATITDSGTTRVTLVKNGSGTLDLSSGNNQNAGSGGPPVQNSGHAIDTYSGGIVINGGLVLIRDDRNLGAIPSLTQGGAAANVANAITLNGGEIRMTATITLDSHRGLTLGPQGGIISYNGGNTTNLSGFQITGPGAIQFSCIPSFGGVASTNQCAIRVNYTTGANNYVGATTFFTQGNTNGNPINAVIITSQDNEVPDASPVTVTNNDGKGVLNLFGHSDTWGSLAGNGNILNSTATVSNLTVGGNNLSTTYSGSLGKTGVTWSVGAAGANGDVSTGTTAAITLTKNGTGTMTMSGVNGYTGATKVNVGKLLVTGSLAATPVTVASGAALGGSGTIAGAVSVASGGILAPAVNATTPSTLTINNTLFVTGGASFNYLFGNPGVSDTINVTGAVTLTNGIDTLNISPLSGFGTGSYNLITAAAPITDNATFQINGNPAFLYSVATSGNNLVLTVTPGNPVLTWTGQGSSTWQNGGPTNWFNGAANSAFANGNNAVFDDNGILAAPVVTVAAGGVTASSVTFNQSAGSYTFNGGPITVNTATGGTGTITIQSGDVIFNNNVTAVLTSIQNGTLKVNGGLTSNVAVSSGTTLFATSTITGNATLAGTGIINLSGAGNITGSLTTTDGNWNGSGSVGSVIVNGGTFTIAAGASLTTAGGVTVNNAGSIVAGSTGTTLAGSLTYSSSAIDTFQGAITGAGSAVSVTGPGTLILSGTNTYGGGTSVSGGLLQFNSPAAIGGSGANVTVANGGTVTTAYTMDQAFINRIAPASAGVVALSTDDSNSFNFSAAGNARLGAIGAVNYTGTLTPNGTTYRLGGGGGTLTFSSQLVGANSLDVGLGGTSGGTVILPIANTLTGGVALNGGGLVIKDAAALGTGPFAINGGSIDNGSAGPITLANNIPVSINASFGYGGTQSLNLGTQVTQTADATITTAGTGTLTIGNGLTGGFSLIVTGTGSGGVVLNGASNTFNNLAYSSPGVMSVAGNTTINGSLRVFGGTVNQPNPNTYQFSVTGGGLVVAPNVTMTAAGLVMGGVDANNGNTSSSATLTLGTGSSLSVDSTAAATNIVIGSNSGSNSVSVGTALVAQGNAAVSLKAPGIVIGVGGGGTGQRSNVLVSLGSGNNSLIATTATGIAIGNTSNGGQDGNYLTAVGNNLGLSMVVLGTGNNTIQTPNLFVSGFKSPGYMFLGNGPTAMTASQDGNNPSASTTYAPPVPLRNPTNTGYAQVTISDAGGAKTTMIIGNQSGGATATNSFGVLDTTGGILNGTFGTVTLGRTANATTNANGGGVGSWVLGVANNNVTVDNIQMTNNAAASATLGITAAVFSLNGGTVQFAASGTGFSFGNTGLPVNTAINLNGGTLDMNGSPVIDPNTSSVLLGSFGFNGGTLKNATGMFIIGGLTQNGGVILRDQAGTTTIGNGGVFPGSDVYTIAGGAVIQLNAGASNSVAVSAGSLNQTTAGTLDIIPVTGHLDAAAAPRELVQITTSPTPTNGILPAYIVARVDGTATASADFTTYDNASGSIARFTAYSTGNLNTAGPNDVINVANATNLTASPTVFAMKLSSTISGAGNLTIGTAGTPAGLIMDGGTISANSLTFASDAQIFATGKNGTITSPITTNGDLTTFGPGTLTLNNTVANIVAGINVNSGTLYVAGPTNASGAVSVKNGATLAGTGAITMSGSNGLTLGPKATFAPGFATGANVGNNFGVLSITTTSGNVTTATATTNPTSLTSAGLTFGLGISPTNVVGSVISLNLGAPAASGAANSGLSNASTLGSRASGFSLTSTSGGTFTLDPISTVLVNGNPANFTASSSYSYLVGSVPTGSAGAVSNLGNFSFSNLGSSFNSNVSAASLMVSGSGVYLNFTTTPVPEPTMPLLVVAAAGLGGFVRRRFRKVTPG